MTKRKKFWLGFLTFLPLLTIFLYFLSFFFMWFGLFTGNGDEFNNNELPKSYLVSMLLMFMLIVVTIIATIGIMIYYILHANKHFNTTNDNQKLIWILVLILAGGVGNLVYFLAVIMPLKPSDQQELQEVIVHAR